ncbi:MAG: FAD/NAD(P)-binding protein, partial [Pseudomonadota bacterium]
MIGAGIFGLSVAYALQRVGATVEVVDAGPVGGGASGGVVGALCPHAPTRWRPFKQFQFDALCALPARIAEIEETSGLSTGYVRSGRLTPLTTARARIRAEAEADAARETWGGAATFKVLDEIPD